MKVVIIEDDKFLRDIISQKLSRDGFQVSSAVDGEEGMKIIYDNPPDLLLLDLILPGADGFEILERLKKNPKTAPIPVLVLSNLSQKTDVDRAMALGAEDFMVKSNFTPEEISNKVRQVLQKKYI